MNCPASVVSIIQVATAHWPGSISPRDDVSDGCAGWLFTCTLRMEKLMSSPFSLSTIFGCAAWMVTSRAMPLPTFFMISPKGKGTLGSICGVSGSSA